MTMGFAAALLPKTDILDVLVFVNYTCEQTFIYMLKFSEDIKEGKRK